MNPAVNLLPEGALHIGGAAISDSSGGELVHIDPTTATETKPFALAGATEVDQAVQAARKAFPVWSNFTAQQKRDCLEAIAAKLIEEGDQLAAICALDNGTPVMAGIGVASAIPADWFKYYAGWIDKLEGAVPVSSDPANFWYTRRVPFGVVGVITAFNAPMAFMGLKVAAALAAGNTVVIKPSELAPWTVLRFAEICREAGLPDGTVNVVPGGLEAGQALVSHSGIDRLTFTGGDATARSIMTMAAENLTPITLELGGKSASIIFDDANIASAAALAVQGSIAFISGQACVAGSRILAHRSVYDEVVEAAAQVAQMLPVGNPSAPDTVIGPVINEHHCNRILSVIESATQNDGARLVCGGERAGGELAKGYFIQPTVIADVAHDSSLAQNEVFGPVASVTPFDTEDEAIAMANDSRYGLAGFVHTENIARGHRVAHAIDAGLITVNSNFAVPANVPFGGMKTSGFGREGGPDGILEMTHSQSIQIGIGKA